MSETAFTSPELATLREHGFAIFANRVIFDAQPPMKEAEIQAVQAVCSGPSPAQLLDLWRLTAGGSLDYSLDLEMAGNREGISWTELFYNGSSRYHDLEGWIEHELELAEEAHEQRDARWNHKLDVLPFGGFEYCDRIYIDVETGESHGTVLAWKMGLPPAWTHRLHEDSVATISSDLRGAFSALHLPDDPLAPTGKYASGETFLAYVSERVAEHGLEQALADRIIHFYRKAILDWRPRVADGTLAQHPRLAMAALLNAIGTDNTDLVNQLASLNVPLDRPVQGSALPVEFALATAHYRAARALIQCGAVVTARCLGEINDAAPVALVELLLARGALPDWDAVIACAEYGATDSADVIAQAGAAREPDFSRNLIEVKRRRIQKINDDLKRVKEGKLGHFLTQDQLKEHAERLLAYRSF